MQKIMQWLMPKKTAIMIVQVVLIAAAFLGKIVWQNEQVFLVNLFIASILGILPILLQALSALQVKVVSIDVLVSIAAIAAMFIRNYEEAAIVTFLFIFGSWLEAKTLNYTRQSIKNLTDLAPDTAWVLQEDGNYEEMDLDFVDRGDLVQVKTGSRVPVDGIVFSGEAFVNQAAITGESYPVKKEASSEVLAGTIVENGSLIVEVSKVGEETTFGRIIELVEEAQDAKSAAEQFIDRFAKYYTPAVLVFGIIVGLVSKNVELAITILVLACPGALVIGVPVSNVAGIGNGAKHGVLLKGSEVIQDLAQVDTIIFDKTGTLTTGQMTVLEEKHYGPKDQAAFEALAAVEKESDHPLARSIVNHLAIDQTPPVDSIDVVRGGGILAQVDGKVIAVGNLYLMETAGYVISDEQLSDVRSLEERGNSIVLLAVSGVIKSLFGIRDEVRPNLKPQLQNLRALGVKNLVLASGDNQGTVDLVAKELGLTEAIGNMLPEDKSNDVKKRQARGETVAFVGDGINDSPSLAIADIGIAMGSGTDVAIETSELVLVRSDFEHLNHAIALAKKTYSNMRQNIFIAISVVLILILMLLFTPYMNMALGMLVHEGSILIVILNAMRLLGFRLKT